MAVPIMTPAAILLFFVCLVPLVSTVSLTSTGSTLLLGDIAYYVPGTPFANLPSFSNLEHLASDGGFIPVTVIGTTPKSSFSTRDQLIQSFEVDDVWNEGFLEGALKFLMKKQSQHEP